MRVALRFGLQTMLTLLGLLGVAIAGMALVSVNPSDADETDEDTIEDKGQPRLDPDGNLQEEPGSDLLDQIDSPAPRVAEGSEDDDILLGQAGNDLLDAIEGDDTLLGGGGDDSLDGGPNNDIVSGGSGADSILGSIGDDALFGNDGDDSLNGGGGHDQLFGGEGDDALHGSLDDDLLIGGGGEDVMHGGSGNDILDGRTDEDEPGFDYLNGGADDDILLGGATDYLNGGTGQDLFAVLAGSDGADAYGAAMIEDYDSSDDTLAVLYDPAGPVPTLSIRVDADGLTLLANNEPVAHLLGQTELDLETVALKPAG